MSIETKKKIIITLTGLKGSGKSTAAKYLVDNYGFTEFSFADPLKKSLSIMLDTSINWFHDPVLKETIIPHWNNTPRYFMTKWGTEVFRETIPKITPEITSLWIELMKKKINESTCERIVVSDCRFDDEAELLRNNGSMVLEISRFTKKEISDSHASEQGINKDYIDDTIRNRDVPLGILYDRIDVSMEEYYPDIKKCSKLESNSVNDIMPALDANRLGIDSESEDLYVNGSIAVWDKPLGVYIDNTCNPQLEKLEIDGVNYTYLLKKHKKEEREIKIHQLDPIVYDEDGNIIKCKPVDNPLEVVNITVPTDAEKLMINGVDQTQLINPDYKVLPSAMIGKKGEEYVLNIIKEAYPEIPVENIASKSRAGDLLFKPHLQTVGYSAQIMFEVKKYSRKVPTAEYDKFLRDISESNHDAGVFVSLTSEITGVTDSIVIKTISSGRNGELVPIIIAHTNDKFIIKSLMALIIEYVTLLRKQGSFINKSDFAVQMIDSLQKSLITYNGVRSTIRDLRAHNDKALDSIQTSLTGNYSEIRSILKMLRGLIELKPNKISDKEAIKVLQASRQEEQKEIDEEFEENTEDAFEHWESYPKIIKTFLDDVYQTDYYHNNWQAYNSTDKCVYIMSPHDTCDIVMKIDLLKTKINCTISGFYTITQLYKYIKDARISASIGEMDVGDRVELGLSHDDFTIHCRKVGVDYTAKVKDAYDSDMYTTIPFDVFTIDKKKKSIKIEMNDSNVDIICRFLFQSKYDELGLWYK
jgi:hypothetical protein